MNASILTSRRYIAIKSDAGLTFEKTLRILTKEGMIIPARWNDEHRRLESVGFYSPSAVVPMYAKSRHIEAKLAAAGVNFEWLDEGQAKELTA